MALFGRGRVPVIGIKLARPLIEVAGRDADDEIMMPLPLAVAEPLPCLSAGRPQLRRRGPRGGAFPRPRQADLFLMSLEIPANRGRQHGR
jgi:hypothetical protein